MIRRSGLLLGLLFALFVAPAWAAKYSAAGLPTTDLTVRTAEGGEYQFHVEVARSASELAKGLMYRTGMPADTGMLFVFDSEAERSFWMKNTFIPLDIIFIKADGAIRTIHPSARQLSLEPLPSGGPVIAALELNGGTAVRLGIKPGDIVSSGDFLANKVAP